MASPCVTKRDWKNWFLPPIFHRSSSGTHWLAKLLVFYFTISDRPLSKPHGPWPAGVGGPWNPKSLNLPQGMAFSRFFSCRILTQDITLNFHEISIFFVLKNLEFRLKWSPTLIIRLVNRPFILFEMNHKVVECVRLFRNVSKKVKISRLKYSFIFKTQFRQKSIWKSGHIKKLKLWPILGLQVKMS